MYEALRLQIEAAVAGLVDGPHRVIVHATGSTGGLGQWLWVPGASSFLVGYDFTYQQAATEELMGRGVASLIGFGAPAKFVSDYVAIQMAAAAYERAAKFGVMAGDAYRPIIAVGITAAVSTNRARRGDDLAIICVRTDEGFFLVDLPLEKARDSREARVLRREEQAMIIDLAALNMILWAAGRSQIPMPAEEIAHCRQLTTDQDGHTTLVPSRVDKDPEDIFDQVFTSLPDFEHPTGLVVAPIEGHWSGWCLFPGSFNPLHYGHLEMARWAEHQTGKRVLFQISQHHPVKKELAFDEGELRRRIRQFRYRHPVVVTRHDGLYIDKTRRFPGAHILMGADALVQMLDPAFYRKSGGIDELKEALHRCKLNGTVFWVVDREMDGRVLSLADIETPAGYEEIFRHLAAVNPISSTAIRAQQRR